MVKRKQLNNIFLSASIPSPDRHKIYYDTADITAIRDAVKALATVVIPKANLIWGGHPSITPLIKYILEILQTNTQEHVTLYQSLFFKDVLPPENEYIENVIFTDKLDSLKESIGLMRERMLKDNSFSVGIFIGGMEGIEEEYNLFKTLHPKALILPVASTGAGAKIIFEKNKGQFSDRLNNEYAYMSLFNDLLKDII